MIRFSMFGIPIEVQPFFWLTLLILGGSSGIDSSTAILELMLFALAAFISVLVHELGHALTAKKFGANTQIVLQAFGGYAAYSGVRMSRLQSFLVTAAGPLAQIALGALVLIVARQFSGISDLGKSFLNDLIWVSFVWALINCLPVMPLDGGQMLNALLGPARIKLTLSITIVTAVVVGVIMFTRTHSFIFPIFLGMFAWQAYQALSQFPRR